MHASDLRLGPVLSLRGVAVREGRLWWQVSAMVAVPLDAGLPALQVGGRDAGAPVVLMRHLDLRVLRYDLGTPLGEQERAVTYGFADAGLSWSFTAPAADLRLRFAYASCNGFSETKKIRQYAGRATTVWTDLVAGHDAQRCHVLMLGGDQVYMDCLWEELAELKEWAELSHEEQRAHPVSAALQERIEAHYVRTYLDRWLPARRGAWTDARADADSADAMARIPTLMMWDDHDIFDGWGSYSPGMQAAPLPQALFACARRAFWVFQMQHRSDLLPPFSSQPVTWSALRAQDPLLLPLLDEQPGFTSAMQLGPLALVVADLRSERTQQRVLGEATWASLRRWLADLPRGHASGLQHLLFLSSVPIAFPSVALIDELHDIFGADHVTESNADDLKDHWSHEAHGTERAALVRLLVDTARDKRIRVSVASGDVHVAAWGSLAPRDGDPFRWPAVPELIASGIVHPPSTGPVHWVYTKLLERAAAAPQKVGDDHIARMHRLPDAASHLVEARNWLAIALAGDGRLQAHWRCERAAGGFDDYRVEIEPAPPA